MNEVSIIQHAKDTHPQTVTVGQVVEMIRGDQWPPGYQPLMLVQGTFEGGIRQKDITRLSGLSVVMFKVTDPAPPFGHPAPAGVGNGSLPELREEARDDPHTLLLFTTRDTLTVVFPYELDVGYELHLQRQFYRKAFLFGSDYYEQLLGLESVRKGKSAGVQCPLAHDPQVYYNPQAEPFLAWEVKEGCRRQSSRPKNQGGLRERKPNYRETMMSLEEIEEWVEGHIELRRNVITMQKEYRWKEDTSSPPESGGEWRNFDDEAFNDVWRPLQKIKDTKEDHLRRTLDSSFVTSYNPFTAYLESLPPWDGDDYIRGLALTVSVAGGDGEWLRFSECLRKWLVAMVAGWLHPEAVNHEVLVLIGRQGIYKTTWMNALLPPPLRSYFSTLSGVGDNPKDEELALTQFGLISCEELDTMTTREMNRMKRAVTLSHVNVRPPYGRYTVHRKHIASFCGTGNNEKFLNDPTGTRRWLAFKVENITPPGVLPFEYEGIYAQAYWLYRNGFEYWFSGEEAKRIDAGNSRFRVANLERQLVYRHYRLPSGADAGELVSVADAMLQISGSITSRLRKEAVEQAFIDLGFEPMEVDGMSGYRAVRRTPEEINGLGRQLAARVGRAKHDLESSDHF